MAEIKAIETIYNGYRFRSRLEARWAVFFDALGVKYEYEKEGYNLGTLGCYLPDFLLPEEGWFIEVKGGPDEEGCAKARYLDDHPPKDQDGNLIAWGCFIVSDIEYPKVVPFPEIDNMLYVCECIAPNRPMIELYNAVTKARQARFEYGEKG